MKIVALEDVAPSTYNPRKADPRRLDLIELSLRKLGWLLPIYADAEGEILSGHQRHHVATRMGATHVPVEFTRAYDLQTRKAINLAFNRGTNDLREVDTPKTLTEALDRIDLQKLAGAVPDRDVRDPSWFRCLYAEKVETAELTRINTGRWTTYALAAARSLRVKGIEMPVICTPDRVVVNGIGRLQDAAEQGRATVDVVTITPAEAALSDAFLNLLSMDFDVHGRYADELRFNAFRRSRTRGRIQTNGNEALGLGFLVGITGRGSTKGFDIMRAGDRRRFREFHGQTILDFGAGRLNDTRILNAQGFDVTAFEPFLPVEKEDRVDTEASRELTRGFLARVADGTRWTSIVLASVLNSVPFVDDRRKIITLVASLAGPKTTVHAYAGGLKKESIRHVTGRGGTSENATRSQFALEYEPNTVIGEIARQPKVQRFHGLEEFAELWRERFEVVRAWEARSLVCVSCRKPRPIPADELEAAIRFEFDLPHPDGARLGLAEEALEAWRRRADSA